MSEVELNMEEEIAKPDVVVKWIWFDLDDTLYDFMASSHIALDKVYELYGLGRWFDSEEQWRDIYHKHNAAMWKLYNAGTITQQELRFQRFYLPLQEVGVPDDENRRLNPLLDRDYLDALGSAGLLIKGADRVLRHLKSRGYHIGILSNGFRGVQHQKLRSSGIESLIDSVILSDDIGVNKPDRRIFDYALQQSGAIAAESVMIGDNPDTDIAGAVAAGWSALLFAPRTTQDNVQINGKEIAVLSSLDMLLNW